MDVNKILENKLLDTNSDSIELRKNILNLVSKYAESSHKPKPFVPGKSLVPVSGKVYGSTEMEMLVASALDFWLTTGRFNNEFEKQLAQFLEITFAITTNSGSSANLLAISSLTSEKLERPLKPGDEVITVAAGFPTTVNPIIQNNLVPVFVDVQIPTYVADASLIEDAITDKTKAIMMAHTLGNPFDIHKVVSLAKKHNLWLIEDCCDALGTKFDGKYVGSMGDVSTISFYPAHHITMGEGGAVLTNNSNLKIIIDSFRDWGRDCYCNTGKSNTCGKRFEWELGDLPPGYDHKYTYSHVGYNLKITDMQASVGLGQLQFLSEFIKKRKSNFEFLKENLKPFENYLILPEATVNSEPAWFGFPITIKESAPFTREELISFLSSKLVDTRPLFAGNIVRQPSFKNIKYKIHGKLTNTDIIMRNSFWIGVYPGLTEEMLQYVVAQFEIFLNKFSTDR